MGALEQLCLRAPKSLIWHLRHLVLGQTLGRFPVGVDGSPKDLVRYSFLGHFRHNCRINSWDHSIRTSGLTFWASWISDLCSLSRSVTPRTLRKHPISAVYSFDSILSVVTWDSWPQVRIGTKTNLKTKLCVVWKPVWSTGSNKAHAELHLLHQSVYQSLCFHFCHSWIPPQRTWTSPPAAVYFRSLAGNTALSDT